MWSGVARTILLERGVDPARVLEHVGFAIAGVRDVDRRTEYRAVARAGSLADEEHGKTGRAEATANRAIAEVGRRREREERRVHRRLRGRADGRRATPHAAVPQLAQDLAGRRATPENARAEALAQRGQEFVSVRDSAAWRWARA
jgi:hypothetical protein